MVTKDAGYLTIRVTSEEKEWFESIAAASEMSVSAFLRYELETHYRELERKKLLAELKRLVAEKPENWDRQRLELLHDLTRNATSALRWIKNRMKHYGRQVKRLEQFTRGIDDLERKALETLADLESENS